MSSVIVYARVSSDKQQEDGTIQSQLDAIQHHPGLRGRDIAEVYADDGVSGYSKALWERPAGARLLADAASGKWRDCDLVIYKLNRLGRRGREIEEAIDRLLEFGITVASLEGYRFDNQTAMGKFARQLFASLAELDRNNIVENTRAGLVRVARDGKLMPSQARLGYDWSASDAEGRKAKGAKLVVNPKEAELVRLIFERFPAMTNGGLVKWLNENGYRRPVKRVANLKRYGHSQRFFAPKALSDILTDRLYTGTVSWGEFRHHFPPLQIISFEQFNATQAILKNRRTVSPKSQGSPFTFSGLVKCPYCGGPATGSRYYNHPDYHYREVRRYRCHAYDLSGKTACKGWTAEEPTIKKAVIPFLTDLFENKLGIRAHFAEAAQELQRGQRGDRAQALQADLDKAQADLGRLQEGFVAGVFTTAEAGERSLEVRERIERTQAKLKTLNLTVDLKVELASALRLLDRPLEEFLAQVPDATLAALCREIFTRFSIKAEGFGWERRANLVTYELTPAVKTALAEAASTSGKIVSTAPAMLVV